RAGPWFGSWTAGATRNVYISKLSKYWPQNAQQIEGSCGFSATETGYYCPIFVPYFQMQRPDGYSMLGGWVQGARSYDPTSGQWLTPDAYAGDVHDPMSQKPFMWNNNNPAEWSDPTGYCVEDAGVDCAVAATAVGDAAIGVAFAEGGAEVAAGVEEAAGNASAANSIRQGVSQANGLFSREIGSLARQAGDTTGKFARGITTFTKHALNQIISRDAGRGVANTSIVSTLRTTTKAVLQDSGNILKVGGRGGLIVMKALNGGVKVITVVGKPKAPQ
ncbi:MAG TPA: hypothetical protein VGX91_03875, partial [Candidatus Cybelea sp.]|nr:hypothetical protein [Candidatus Cybelea sp.]